MQSGHIEQFTHLSHFQSTEEFNEAITTHFKRHLHQFTKAETIALNRLIRYSVKYHGVCNAKAAKIIQATHTNQPGISRSTFERMLVKARTFGIIKIYHTIRKGGGYSHCVYVFQPPEEPETKQLTERPHTEKPDAPTPQATKIPSKAFIKHKAIKQDQDHSHTSTIAPSIEQLLHSTIPKRFVNVTEPFTTLAPQFTERLWYSALSAYKQTGRTAPIEDSLPLMIQAFKVTIAKYKHNHIETTIFQYFYGTFLALLAVEGRRKTAEKSGFPAWLVN
ncbi:hypothetical protein BpOF4_06370 [Alkalihalophilus pseudofirmus OF4]|uniref:Uncharacterized protein n=1 Tax=Alkalihalophilus pseudofirmus (strain ATCC BAA-2126 / JCM 17055 / OF4) TaxID=398511 RepID=D3G059_ALKPO|nr:hypothetical protein [Alkalihalophilus pseudofirmus]ADC49334.1 hypothetical protein BpOF4_06370 [Alkalihalophilus pseudofirmus OF4]